jgi:Cro/C1-type HTH DNA-binding domain
MADYPSDLILHSLLRQAGMSSWQQLATTSGISVRRLRKLRQGHIDSWQIGEFQKLSKALQISLSSLLIALKLLPPEQAIIDFQLASFQTIESFLTYWPVAAQQAQLDPAFAASKLLPLVSSIDRLVASWGIMAIGIVGETLPFDPQIHQSLAGSIPTGTVVRIRYPGYCQGDRLLTRAKVSPNS